MGGFWLCLSELIHRLLSTICVQQAPPGQAALRRRLDGRQGHKGCMCLKTTLSPP